MTEQMGPLHFPRSGFVSPPDGTLIWETLSNGTFYTITFRINEKELTHLDAGKVPSVNNIAELLQSTLKDEITSNIGGRTPNFISDVLRMIRTLPSDSPSHFSEYN